jgi:MFS transporter, Spinster family, sphingosine-1-phosphate transporter
MKNRSYLALGLLMLVYVFNFLDRQILSILKEPIATELGLNDTQTGLMGGLAFALLYTGLAVPVAWAADRVSRVWIITGALALWSGFTALCGLAGNFTHLFLARMGVGIGEAGGVAPSYSLIADYFPPHQRSRALAVFSMGIPIGSALGVLGGGLLAALVDWRFAFIAIGLLGLILAPVVRLLLKDPPRGQFDQKYDATISKPLPFTAVLKLAFSKPSFLWLALGAASCSIVGYGFLYWLPTFLARSLGLSLEARSWF